MEGLEENLAAPALPVDAAALREWVLGLPGRMRDVPFQDRLEFFGAVMAVKRELKLLEDLSFLLAREADGSTLERMAGPISRKSLKRAAAKRLEVLHRRFPRGSYDMVEALRERAEKLKPQVTDVGEEDGSVGEP